ncbi:MAG: squalene synthase HpnC [Planctomycetia bacterium]|jgi:squalene synthase HpnC
MVVKASINFTEELRRWGPSREDQTLPTPAESRHYCSTLARNHYENFTVASHLIPRDLRGDFYAVYAYCRWADDLADEIGDTETSLELLDWWEGLLDDCYDGRATHPVFIALTSTIENFAIPKTPFADLLVAFRQDQKIRRYATFDDLLGYCRNSANPVGRLVLYLGRAMDERRAELSDSICTGLQLANFWQDVAEDWNRGRLYLPEEDCQKFEYDPNDPAQQQATDSFRRLLEYEVERAEAYLLQGRPLIPSMPRKLRMPVSLFVEGGPAICREIRRANFDVWTARPTVSRATKLRLMGMAYIKRFF